MEGGTFSEDTVSPLEQLDKEDDVENSYLLLEEAWESSKAQVCLL